MSVRHDDDDNDNDNDSGNGLLTLPGLSAESVGVMNTLSGDNVRGLMSSEELCSLLRDCEAGFDAT